MPVKNTEDCIRAGRGRNSIGPTGVRRYLEDKFGDDLKAVRSAMQKLAKVYKSQELAQEPTPSMSASAPTSWRARTGGVLKAASTWG